MRELEGELLSGEAGDGDVWLGGEQEVGRPVPGHVDGSPGTAQESHLQSGGVDGPGVLDTHYGRLLHHHSRLTLRPARRVGCPAGVHPLLLPPHRVQEPGAVPGPLQVQVDPLPGPGDRRLGVAGHQALQDGRAARGRPHHLPAPGDHGRGGDDELVGLDERLASRVHHTLVYPGVPGLHLQDLQLPRAGQEAHWSDDNDQGGPDLGLGADSKTQFNWNL